MGSRSFVHYRCSCCDKICWPILEFYSESGTATSSINKTYQWSSLYRRTAIGWQFCARCSFEWDLDWLHRVTANRRRLGLQKIPVRINHFIFSFMQDTQSYGALKKKILREAAWLVLRSGRRPLGLRIYTRVSTTMFSSSGTVRHAPVISLRVLSRVYCCMDDSPLECRMDILKYVVTFLF